MRQGRYAAICCLAGIVAACATGPTLHLREDLSSKIADKPVVVHISSARINLINVVAWPDSLTGEIPRFTIPRGMAATVHLYLADDFRIEPDAKRMVIPLERIVRSEIIRRPPKSNANHSSFFGIILGAAAVTILLMLAIVS